GSEGEDSQSRVLASLRGEAGAIGHVKSLRFPALVVTVEYRDLRGVPHPRRAGFVDSDARRLWRLVYMGESYAGEFIQLPQHCNLLVRARQLSIAVSTVYAQHWNSPGVSAPGVERYPVVRSRQHLGERNSTEPGVLPGCLPLVHLDAK